jgi:hypothetical protein
MSVITSPHRPAAEVERATEQNISALDAPNIQLYMTYRGCADQAEISPELSAWLDAKCEDTGCSALDVLIACAEMCADLE